MGNYTLDRYHIMQSLIEASHPKDKIILDLGAGPNPISASIKCYQCILMDHDLSSRPTVACNFLQGIPLSDNSVDIIVLGEILEHVTRSRYFLREMRRILRMRGIVVLSVPNIVSLKYRAAFLLGRIPAHAAKADYTYDETNPHGHVRDYSFGEIRKVFTDHGFRIVAERSNGTYIGNRRIIHPRLMPVTFSDNVIVQAIKSET